MKKIIAKIMAVLSPIPVASFSAYAENESPETALIQEENYGA